jgi:metacaspase-1
VLNLTHFLTEELKPDHQYKREDMVILTDDSKDPVLQPTKANILRAMKWLVKDAQPNDSLFLHYSGKQISTVPAGGLRATRRADVALTGHGGQTEDLDGDEGDGFDEVIYPVDHIDNGHIVDDDVHAIVVKPLPPGTRLTSIFDSCHSGSMLDLPYVYSTKGVLKEPNLAKEAGQGLLSAVMSYARGDLGGVGSALMGFAKSAMTGDKAHEQTIRTKTSPADVISWSGSKDDQTSADATIASQATGAMSYAFIRALTENSDRTYLELLNRIRDILEEKYTQKPQLSCSHPLGEFLFPQFWG